MSSVNNGNVNYKKGIAILNEINSHAVLNENFTADDFVNAVDRNHLSGLDIFDFNQDVELAKKTYSYLTSFNSAEYVYSIFEARLLAFIQSGQSVEICTPTPQFVSLVSDTKQRLASIEATLPPVATIETVFNDERNYLLIRSVSRPYTNPNSNGFTHDRLIRVTWINGSETEIVLSLKGADVLSEDFNPNEEYARMADNFYRKAASYSEYGDEEMREDYKSLKEGELAAYVVLGGFNTAMATVPLYIAKKSLEFPWLNNKFGLPLVILGLGALQVFALYQGNEWSEIHSPEEFIRTVNADPKLKEERQLQYWLRKHLVD